MRHISYRKQPAYFFGESISTSQLLDLARDAQVEVIQAAGDSMELPNAIAAMEKATRRFCALTVAEDNTRFIVGCNNAKPGF